MKRFNPAYGLAIVLVVTVLVLATQWVMAGGSRGFERVGPDDEGRVVLDLTGLERQDVRFYRFLNYGNQEVKFFVGRDGDGVVHVAFDASENDYKRKRGFRFEDGWMVNNKCDTAGRLTDVNSGGGGCRPVPLPHSLDGDRLTLFETDILAGWRYFR